jgi:membrane complex biogenesis BtpA family protein
MNKLMNYRVIGMVQPEPLPGSYRHDKMNFDEILELVLYEAKILYDCGFDAILLQNMGDMPIRQISRPEAIAYMTIIAREIKHNFPQKGLGILVNWDGVASLSVADAAKADFIRVEHVYNGIEVSSAGLLQAQCCEILDLKKRIGCKIPILADVYEPHAAPLGPLAIEDAAWQTVNETFADGIFISGNTTEDSIEYLMRVRRRIFSTPIFLGGGANGDNASKLAAYFDGICVATWIKDGNMANPVNKERAKSFVDIVHSTKKVDVIYEDQ